MTRRRLAAVAALAFGGASVVFAAIVAVENFPNAILVLLCLALAVVLAWYGVRRRGSARIAGLGGAVLLLAGALVLLVVQGSVLENAIVLVGVAVTLASAGTALAIRPALPRAPDPRHPVLFMNPRSGGGKATKFHLADEARKRGIEAVELEPGDDLWELVRDAVARGADALAMAGGDGSQAIVAAVAAEEGLPYACIPAGTRNHFALDLGVDRTDVVGALEAFVDGGERMVDLAEVNGRVFVNNVSLGLYAEAVQQDGYRDAKIRTILDTVPDVLGPHGQPLDLGWTGPDGTAHDSAATILVSNNRYRLGRLIGSGTRPRLDEQVLGVAAVRTGGGAPLEWSSPEFSVDSNGQIAAGVDGEAVKLTPPVHFRMRPAALRVRIARAHPGASPSAAEPGSLAASIARLASVALHAPSSEPEDAR